MADGAKGKEQGAKSREHGAGRMACDATQLIGVSSWLMVYSS